MQLVEKDKYRSDIDGLRAFAVIAVIIFHLGFLPNGFLGVDVFFLISGYLITDILFKEIHEDRYSVVNFYVRRIRRILPLVSFICLLALVLGICFMLPDDLENLAQSVIATNFFGNNVLQTVTTKNYWDVVNEYKPLMHTWSLAVEEQYYFVYPIIFSLFGKKRKNWILPIIIGLTVISLVLYILPFQDYLKFYLLPFRFFEMSVGGIAAVLLNGRVIKTKFAPILLILLVVLMAVNIDGVSPVLWLLITVIVACGVLCVDNTNNPIAGPILTNPIVRFIGNISFSLYMWHQVLFAFGRYMVFDEIDTQASIILVLLTFVLSIGSYYAIEQPFRNKKKFKTSTVVWTQIAFFVVTTGISGYLFLNTGVVKDVPELGISTDNIQKNMHSAYNHRIYKLNKPFTTSNKKKILVIGDSFARDWVNVLNESVYADSLEVTYLFGHKGHDSLVSRINQADYVFYSTRLILEEELKIVEDYQSKVWVVGTKNFGFNNGLYYNYSGDDYCNQRVKMEKMYPENNAKMKALLGNHYLDLMGLVVDSNNTVPVFNSNCMFISQDCRHLTKAGAQYFARLIPKLKNLPFR